VENILIDQAFKIEKLFKNPMEKANQYIMVDYANPDSNLYSHSIYQPHPQQYSGYYVGNYFPYNYSEIAYSQQYLQSQYPYPFDSEQVEQGNELNQLKRSLGCLNLVHTRKKDKDRYQ
jgi:hypothetical protein